MQNIILVCSGKGGVGKTTVTANLGRSFAEKYSVALLDLDLACPNLPVILGMDKVKVTVDLDHYYPEMYENMQIFSSAFMIPDGVACTWDGSTRMRLTKELLERIKWDTHEYMFIDFLPGCGDELMAAIQLIPNIAGAVIVTNSTKECISDVKRLKAMFDNRLINVNILGAVDNMSRMMTGKRTIPLFTDGIDIEAELGIEVIGTVVKKKPLPVQDFSSIRDRIIELIRLKEENHIEEVISV